MSTLAACGSSDDGGSGTTAEGSGKVSVGIVGFASADQTSQLAITGYRKVADQKGWEVTYVDPGGSADKAVAAMQNLVQKKVDIIVTAVFPASSLAGGAVAAKAAGIPVVSLSGGTGTGVQVNYDSGIQQGKDVAKRLVADTGGKGKLLVLGYKSGLPCIEREAGLTEALKATSIAVTREEVPIPGQVEASIGFTQAWLAKNPQTGDGLAVWGCFDDPALGAVSAVASASRKDVKIYGINGQPGAIKAVEAGSMSATIWLNAEAAGEDMANNTEKYIAAGVDAPPADVAIPSILVASDTVKEFLTKYPQSVQQ
ncbi:MAG TPA: sugar ABC transporter substrate-binding protein [Mycobacteriales bacterium]|nr:sugar ABC transporter substrate-binding protein [Mycobacteriales bacterium]